MTLEEHAEKQAIHIMKRFSDLLKLHCKVHKEQNFDPELKRMIEHFRSCCTQEFNQSMGGQFLDHPLRTIVNYARQLGCCVELSFINPKRPRETVCISRVYKIREQLEARLGTLPSEIRSGVLFTKRMENCFGRRGGSNADYRAITLRELYRGTDAKGCELRITIK